METRVLIGILAVALAFTSLFAGLLAVSVSLRRRMTAMTAQGEVLSISGLVRWRLRNGFDFLQPAVRKILSWERAREFADDAVIACSHRGWPTSRESLLSVLLVLLGMIAVVVGIVLGNAIGAVACALCLVAVSVTLVGNEKDRRNEEIREAIPDIFRFLTAMFHSPFV